MENKKIGSLTGLRFILIMTIVISHSDLLRSIPYFGNFYINCLQNPIIGVDFFFLLSGFGMMFGSITKTSLEDMKTPTPFDGLKYAIKHIRKTYPVYILIILFCFFLKFSVKLLKSTFSAHFIKEELGKLIVNSLLLQSFTGCNYFIRAYNTVAWFLSTLFCIYIISPYLIFLLRKISKTIISDIILMLINIFAVILTAFFFGKIDTYFDNTDLIIRPDAMVYCSPFRRVFYVLIGMNIATFFSHVQESAESISERKMSIAEIIISLIVSIYYLSRNSIPATLFIYIIDMVICSSLIFIFAFDKGCISNFLNKPLILRFGNLSMYIFLIHEILQSYILLIIEKTFNWQWNTLSIILFILFILLSTYILSEICYRIQNRKNIS